MKNPATIHAITLLRQRSYLAGQLERTDLADHHARRMSSQFDAIDYALALISDAEPDAFVRAETEFARIGAIAGYRS